MSEKNCQVIFFKKRRESVEDLTLQGPSSADPVSYFLKAFILIDQRLSFNQCCGSGSVWIRFILISRIRIGVAKNQPKSWKMSKKINENHKNIIYFFSKLLNLCLLT